MVGTRTTCLERSINLKCDSTKWSKFFREGIYKHGQDMAMNFLCQFLEHNDGLRSARCDEPAVLACSLQLEG